MIWTLCLALSFGVFALITAGAFYIRRRRQKVNKRTNLLVILAAAVLLATILVFFPVYVLQSDGDAKGMISAGLLSLFTGMQVFTIGTEYQIILDHLEYCHESIQGWYQLWSAVLFVLAPVFTFGFVMSLFKNVSAMVRYWMGFFRDAYIFSELNERSIALAKDIKRNHPGVVIVFTSVFEEQDEATYELVGQAKDLGAICFKKDMASVNFRWHWSKRKIFFFAIGENQAEDLDEAMAVLEKYLQRENTELYIFSNSVESELLISTVSKGKVRVRRIHTARAQINQLLYEHGEVFFETANAPVDGVRDIHAVVVGMGGYGTELTRALAWFGQMEGYSIHVDAFDKDPLAADKFTAQAPELMDEKYNGRFVPGEARYSIHVHSDMDVETQTFAKAIQALKRTTYVLVSLGDDEENIRTAVHLRMLFEQIRIHPVIQTIVYNSKRNKALSDAQDENGGNRGLRNHKGQPYDVQFIGHLEESYSERVIISSRLEEEARKLHIRNFPEALFWKYEFNYRSSIASAIHAEARIRCGIPGADKPEEERTEAENVAIGNLEHRRWNAYMRSEGYIYSGSPDAASRNDLAKMHHNLVSFSELTEADKQKDYHASSR